MKILVCFKLIPDFAMMQKSDWKSDQHYQLDTSYLRKIINVFDESALELALQIKKERAEQGQDTTLCALTIGDSDHLLDHLMALPYDEVAWIESDPQKDLRFCPQTIASALGAFIQKYSFDLVFLGQHSGESGQGQTAPLLAEILDWPYVFCACAIQNAEKDGELFIKRHTAHGTETWHTQGRLIVSIGNTPGISGLRQSTLKERIQAKDRRATRYALADFLDSGQGLSFPQLCALTPVAHERTMTWISGTPEEQAEALYQIIAAQRPSESSVSIKPIKNTTTQPPSEVTAQVAGRPIRTAALILDQAHPRFEQHLEEAASFLQAAQMPSLSCELWLFPHPEKRGNPLLLPQTLSITALHILPRPSVLSDCQALDILLAHYASTPKQFLFFASDLSGQTLATRMGFRLKAPSLTHVLHLEEEKDTCIVQRSCYQQEMSASFAITAWPFCGALGEVAEQKSPFVAFVTFAGPVLSIANYGPEICTDHHPDYLIEIIPAQTLMEHSIGRARTVLALGQGVGSVEAFSSLKNEAEKRGFAVGCSRPVALNAWADFSLLLGVSGEIIAPEICLAAGVSGSGAFCVGIRKSQKIIAINTNRSAPIFSEADIGIVGDLHQLLPALFSRFDAHAFRSGTL